MLPLPTPPPRPRSLPPAPAFHTKHQAPDAPDTQHIPLQQLASVRAAIALPVLSTTADRPCLGDLTAPVPLRPSLTLRRQLSARHEREEDCCYPLNLSEVYLLVRLEF